MNDNTSNTITIAIIILINIQTDTYTDKATSNRLLMVIQNIYCLSSSALLIGAKL